MKSLQIYRLLAIIALLISCSSDESTGSDATADTGNDLQDVYDVSEDVDMADGQDDGLGTDIIQDLEADETPIRRPVTESGDYRVGYRETYLTYQPDGSDDDRTVRVVMWYPTDDESGFDTRYMGIVRRPDVITEAVPLSIVDQPVFVFSHGSNGIAEQTYLTMEFFASHGWLVLALDHTGNTFEDLDAPVPPDIFVFRPQDVSAVLDFAYGLTDVEFPLEEPGEDVIMGGHSFGGYTTFANVGAGFAVDEILANCESGGIERWVCDSMTTEIEAMLRAGFSDPRVDVAIPMAPGGAALFSAAGLESIDVPVLLITGALDTMTPDESEGDEFWAGLNGSGDIRVEIATAGHMSFTSLCEDLPEDLLEQGCGDGYIDPAELAFVTNAYTLAFARHHLWGDDADLDLLDGTRSLSDDVSLSTH